MLVFGQDKAIEQLSATIKLSRAGLARSTQTRWFILICGPHGVGKTEVTAISQNIRRGINSLRYVRIYGKTYGFTLNWRASRLCWL